MKGEKHMKATIDRIEGNIAVLIVYNDEPLRLNVPVSLLPTACEEGDILTLEIRRDAGATEAVKARVSGLIEKLENRSEG